MPFESSHFSLSSKVSGLSGADMLEKRGILRPWFTDTLEQCLFGGGGGAKSKDHRSAMSSCLAFEKVALGCGSKKKVAQNGTLNGNKD